jgi:peptidoglycan hydrolase-like protein with peptidoglycan-binding domain
MGMDSGQIKIVRSLADRFGIPQDFALGLTDKESNGNAFWNVAGYGQMPSIRPEVHKFYSFLSGAKRDLAVRQGLASAKPNGVKLPTTYKGLYQFLDRMKAIDETAALKSISMGIGQVMGFNYKLVGFYSPQVMWLAAKSGFTSQVEMMFKFIVANPKLLAAAKRYDYKTFAYGYNGKNYKQNNYDVDLKKYTEKWKYSGNRPDGLTQIVDPYVTKIIGLGYKTVRDFQSANGLEVDGTIGKLTRDKVDEVLTAVKAEVAPAKAPVVVAGGALGVGAVTATVEATKAVTDAAQPVVDTVTTLASIEPTTILIAALVVTVGFGAYWLYTKYKAKQKLALIG